MSTDGIDGQLRAAFRRRRDAAARAAPSFEALLPPAPPGRWLTSHGRWLVPVAGALIAAAIWWPDRAPAPQMETEILLAELTSSTYWRAPSDRWLGDGPEPAWQGLPKLSDPLPRSRLERLP
jgi:hypothetical protein